MPTFPLDEAKAGRTSDPAFSKELVVELFRPDASLRAVLLGATEECYPQLFDCRSTFLHPNERGCFEAFRFERRRIDYLLGRYCAKRAASHLLCQPDLAQIEIAAGVFQQPLVKYADSNAPGVCITHSHGVACALAFPAEHPMAVDIETVDPSRLDILQREIRASEVGDDGTSKNKIALYTQLWTAKEALSKILRCGLTTPFAIFETEDLHIQDGCCSGFFKNFPQYRFQSRVIGRLAFGIVLPRKTELRLDWAALEFLSR